MVLAKKWNSKTGSPFLSSFYDHTQKDDGTRCYWHEGERVVAWKALFFLFVASLLRYLLIFKLPHSTTDPNTHATVLTYTSHSLMWYVLCERTRSLGIQKLQKAHYIKGCTRYTPLSLSQLCNDVKSYYLFEECITIYHFLFALSLLLNHNIRQ